MTALAQPRQAGGRPTLIQVILGAAAAALIPIPASAHVGVGDAHGVMHGLAHPFSGADHVLAMTAVGLLAACLGGRALWLLPLTFLSVMALAGFAGMAGGGVPHTEVGVALSVAVLGLAVAIQPTLSTRVASLLVGVFAVFHGHAHGAEMPANASGLAYGAGFLCASALLIGAGLGLGLAAAGQAYGRRLVQLGGAATAVAGVAILLSL